MIIGLLNYVFNPEINHLTSKPWVKLIYSYSPEKNFKMKFRVKVKNTENNSRSVLRQFSPNSNTELPNVPPVQAFPCFGCFAVPSSQDHSTVPGSEMLRLWSEGRRNSLHVFRCRAGRLFFRHSSVMMRTAF